MWEAFKDWIFWCIESLYHVVGDWGMAIIVITLIFRLIITPLMYKQAKSSYMTQKLQPALNRIKEVFADDPVRQNEETQKLYAEAKFNPLAGCVPMLIQLPIFIALFQVLREMGERVETTGEYCFYNLVPDLVQTPSGAFAQGLDTFIPYAILLLLFAFATFVPSLLMMRNQEGQQKTMTMMMMVMMTIMMLFIGWSAPGGVLLFWGASSVLAIIQQQASTSIIKAKDKQSEVEEIDYQPTVVNVTRKEKKKRPTKKR